MFDRALRDAAGIDNRLVNRQWGVGHERDLAIAFASDKPSALRLDGQLIAYFEAGAFDDLSFRGAHIAVGCRREQVRCGERDLSPVPAFLKLGVDFSIKSMPIVQDLSTSGR